MKPILDVQTLTIRAVPSLQESAETHEADLVIVGGGLGGVAAALAACRRGRSVCLLEETDWLGGQATAQGVSALDENPYIETSGGTASYAEFRWRIRDWYRRHTRLTPEAQANERLNPGNGWVSRLCFEPRVGVAVIDDLLRPHQAAGRLQVFRRTKAFHVETEGDRIVAVLGMNLEEGSARRFTGAYFLDATELGDLLPLAGVEHVVGAESRAETGEPHARDVARPDCVQSLTYTFAVEFCPGENHVLDEPPNYAFWRDHQPYTFRHYYGDERGWVSYRMFETGEGTYGPFWTYRRLIDRNNFDDPAYRNDVAMINWPGNDFRDGNVLAEGATVQLDALRRAKELALGLCYWLQTEAPRDDGGQGYPELKLRLDVMDTADGLSQFPYIRESRRIKARTTIREQDVSAAFQAGPRAALFDDAVGIGLYGIDIHPGLVPEVSVPSPAQPFQIPLGALIPVRVTNLLPACKNLGTTHITNGCYRLHPVEWNVGEAAGALAAFGLRTGFSPAEVAADLRRVRAFQTDLAESGVPLFWYEDVPLDHPRFAAIHLRSVRGEVPLAVEGLRCAALT